MHKTNTPHKKRSQQKKANATNSDRIHNHCSYLDIRRRAQKRSWIFGAQITKDTDDVLSAIMTHIRDKKTALSHTATAQKKQKTIHYQSTAEVIVKCRRARTAWHIPSQQPEETTHH